MTSRFPGPWRIAEFPNGFAVYDVTGRQLGFFYGRADPNMAGHAGFPTIDDARQIAVDFARLPELLNQTSGRSEVATSTEDDKLAKLETSCSPETRRLPRAAQLPPVAGLPLAKAPTTIRRSISLEPDGRRSPQMLRRPSDPGSRTKFLILIAVAAVLAGYLFFGDSDPPVVAVVPQVTTNRLTAEFSPLWEAKASLSKATDITVESRIGPAAADSTVESPIEPKGQTAPLQPTAPLDKKPTENGIEARPGKVLNEANKLSDDAAAIMRFVMQRLRDGGDAQATSGRELALGLPANDANFYRERGIAAYRSGDFLGAIGNFDEAIRLNPDDAQSYNIRGNVWDELGVSERALADYDDAIRTNPNNPAVFHDRAILWQRKGALDKALVDLDRAIRFSFADANIYCDRGLVWYQKGRHERAIADFNQAIKLDPSFATAYINRGLILHSNREFTVAFADSKVIRVDPSIFDVTKPTNLRP